MGSYACPQGTISIVLVPSLNLAQRLVASPSESHKNVLVFLSSNLSTFPLYEDLFKNSV